MSGAAKGIAALIVAKAKKPEGEGKAETMAPDEEAPSGLVDAADEALAAVRAGSAADFAAAMKSFVRMCQSSGYGSEEE